MFRFKENRNNGGDIMLVSVREKLDKYEENNVTMKAS